jgi:hypothetical protein
MAKRMLCSLSLIVAQAGCNGEEPETTIQQQPVVGVPGTEVVIDAAAGPVDLQRMYLVRMDGIGGRSAVGTLGLSPAGDQTRVTVRIERAATEGVHRGFLRSGQRCDDFGGAVAELPPVAIEGGAGEGLGMIDRRMQDFMDGESVAVYHAPDGDPGEAVLCGGVPLMPPGLPVEGERP